MTETNRMRAFLTASVFTVAAALAGCSAGDVELNGSVFDTLGIGSKSANANTAKVPERQGLVLPPNLDRLPEPLRARFIDEVTALAANQASPFTLDYWRLNLTATRPVR